MNRFQLLASASVLTLLIGQGADPVAAQEQAGTATAAVPSIQAMLDQRTRSIAIGNPVFREERIQTGPDGHLHVLLRDESNLTIGPNSDLTIDEYVYDPDSGEGNMVMNQLEGAMRFVGGQLSKQNPVQLETPTATIGIRGGIMISRILSGGGVQLFFIFGDSMSVDSKLTDASALADESGTQITVGPDGSITGPEPIDPAALTEVSELLETPEGTAQRTEIPDAVLQNLLDRLEAQGIDPDTGLIREIGDGDPITMRELEELLGGDTLDEQQLREVFEQLREEQINEPY